MKPAEKTDKSPIAAHYLGVDIPHSPFLNDTRIKRINAGRYEGQEVAGGLAVVEEGDTVLELGAGLGFVGAVVARNRLPKKHVAFEGNPNLIEHVEALYRTNGLAGRCSVRNEILLPDANRPETVPFFVHRSFLGSSLSGKTDRTRVEVQVPTASLETTLSELTPDVILMDIEGGELELLEAMDLTGVRAMVVEFHPGVYEKAGVKRCKSILRDAGFSPRKELSTRFVWTACRA